MPKPRRFGLYKNCKQIKIFLIGISLYLFSILSLFFIIPLGSKLTSLRSENTSQNINYFLPYVTHAKNSSSQLFLLSFETIPHNLQQEYLRSKFYIITDSKVTKKDFAIKTAGKASISKIYITKHAPNIWGITISIKNKDYFYPKFLILEYKNSKIFIPFLKETSIDSIKRCAQNGNLYELHFMPGTNRFFTSNLKQDSWLPYTISICKNSYTITETKQKEQQTSQWKTLYSSKNIKITSNNEWLKFTYPIYKNLLLTLSRSHLYINNTSLTPYIYYYYNENTKHISIYINKREIFNAFPAAKHIIKGNLVGNEFIINTQNPDLYSIFGVPVTKAQAIFMAISLGFFVLTIFNITSNLSKNKT